MLLWTQVQPDHPADPVLAYGVNTNDDLVELDTLANALKAAMPNLGSSRSSSTRQRPPAMRLRHRPPERQELHDGNVDVLSAAPADGRRCPQVDVRRRRHAQQLPLREVLVPTAGAHE